MLVDQLRGDMAPDEFLLEGHAPWSCRTAPPVHLHPSHHCTDIINQPGDQRVPLGPEVKDGPPFVSCSHRRCRPLLLPPPRTAHR